MNESQAAPRAPRTWLGRELPGLLAALGLLAFVLVCMESTPLEIRVGGLPVDLVLQDRFFNFQTHQWAVDKSEVVGRLLFYNGPKAVLILLGVGSLVLALLRGRAEAVLRRRFPWLPARRGALFLAVSLIVIPLVCNRGKAITNIYCPDEHERYGGRAPYARLWDSYPPKFAAVQRAHPSERGRGFPAGHASGGFALMALGFVMRRRWAGVLAGCALGWAMGLYQMLKGAHYLSHTLTTWALAWLMLLGLAALIRPGPAWRSRSSS